MRFVLDTNALWHRPLMDALTEANSSVQRHEVVVPALVLAERLRQVRADAAKTQALETLLLDLRAVLEPFGESEARRIPALDDVAWRRHARDLLVASHVHGDRIAVSADSGPAWRSVPCIDPDGACDILERDTDATG